ncbi:unnamed protein product [Mytilus coruscus]|uniref:Ig-like domain-containing protein n=1 Tax=Mytilus coruscus TaxID=42192 RepID=A0A6J8AKQ0_MYTCO|nr:unnamed protein product [Mytilus coruscus]
MYSFKVTWYESSLQGRGNTTGTQLVPSVNSTLILTVKATEVSCKDSAKFVCKVVISGGRSDQDSAQLNVVNGKSLTLLLEARYDNVLQKSITQWNDPDLQYRANLVTSTINPKTNATLKIEIPSYNVKCWDASTYRCELILYGNKFSVKQRSLSIMSSAQYIETKLSTPIALTKDEIKIDCLTWNFETNDTIAEIVLSKLGSNGLSRIFAAQLSFSEGTKLKWYDMNFKSRAVVISARVYPASTSNISLQIPKHNVRCSDAGYYVCEVISIGDKNGKSTLSLNITGNVMFLMPIPTLLSGNGYHVAKQS